MILNFELRDEVTGVSVVTGVGVSVVMGVGVISKGSGSQGSLPVWLWSKAYGLWILKPINSDSEASEGVAG